MKAHARIIWGAAWTPDGSFFATCSRDSTIKLWQAASLHDKAKPVCTIQLEAPVTAIAFAPKQPCTNTAAHSDKPAATTSYSIAVGLDLGGTSIWNVSCLVAQDGTAIKAHASCVWNAPLATKHCSSIRRLCWQAHDVPGDSGLYLASCGDDHTLRIFSVSLSCRET